MKKFFLILVGLLVTVSSFSQTRCGVCSGNGKLVCRVCGGYGMVYQNYFDPFWGTWRTASYYCVGCGGTGAVFCMNCGGCGSIASSYSNPSFKASPTVYYLEDKSKKCYFRSTHFETYKTGSYQIVLSDKCKNCGSSYRNH